MVGIPFGISEHGIRGVVSSLCKQTLRFPHQRPTGPFYINHIRITSCSVYH